jgi:hypothetical protein
VSVRRNTAVVSVQPYGMPLSLTSGSTSYPVCPSASATRRLWLLVSLGRSGIFEQAGEPAGGDQALSAITAPLRDQCMDLSTERVVYIRREVRGAGLPRPRRS